MKPVAFLSALSGLLLASSVANAGNLPSAATPDDTIVVKLPNQVSMTIYARNKQQLRELRAYKLDSLMVMLDGYITQAERAGTKSANGQVTMEFYPAKDKPSSKAAPEQVRVTVRGQQPRTDRVEVTMGRVLGVTIEESTGPGEDHVSVRLGSSANSDSVQQAKRVARQQKISGTDFGVDIGLNALTNRENLPAGEDFDLRPWGSRYIALKWQFWARFGKNNPLYFHLGPEIAFNNFMFEGNRRPIDVDNRTTIVADPQGRSFEKSKLAMTTLNLPAGITVRLRNDEGKEMFRIGGGGFVGYRLGSHTKIKYEEEGRTNKDKDRGSYNLQDFQYGVTGTFGVRNFNLFAKYNLNELFKDNRGPKAQAISFGLTTAF